MCPHVKQLRLLVCTASSKYKFIFLSTVEARFDLSFRYSKNNLQAAILNKTLSSEDSKCRLVARSTHEK